MDAPIERFVGSKKIAIMGASPVGKKFGNTVYKTLKKNGYALFPIHPSADTIENDPAYKNVADIPEKIEAAFICMKPDKSLAVMDNLIAGGIKRIWFQQGADFSESIEKAESVGIEVISGKCILMYAEPVKGLHAFHRWLWKLFGKY